MLWKIYGDNFEWHAIAGLPHKPRAAKHGAKPHSPNLLANMQRGFKALLDGESYVSERDGAAAAGGGKSPSPEPSFLNKVHARVHGIVPEYVCAETDEGGLQQQDVIDLCCSTCGIF